MPLVRLNLHLQQVYDAAVRLVPLLRQRRTLRVVVRLLRVAVLVLVPLALAGRKYVTPVVLLLPVLAVRHLVYPNARRKPKKRSDRPGKVRHRRKLKQVVRKVKPVADGTPHRRPSVWKVKVPAYRQLRVRDEVRQKGKAPPLPPVAVPLRAKQAVSVALLQKADVCADAQPNLLMRDVRWQ